MSAHNFWDNFSHGFMHGMFGNSPFFGCFGGWNMSFCNPFYDNTSLFLVPNVMTTAFYPLMPDIPMPSFNLSMFDMPTFKPTFDFSNFKATSPTFTNPSFTNPSLDTSSFWKSSSLNSPIADTFTRQATAASPTPSQDVSTAKTKTKTKTQTTAAKGSSGETHKYDALISKYAKMYNLEEEFLRAVISVESTFNPNAVSKVGAKGLMQLMPGTAKEMGVKNVFDPEENIRGGAKYLRKMLDRFHNDKKLALAGYNAGAGNVRNGQIPQNGDTPKYVNDVLNKYDEYKSIA